MDRTQSPTEYPGFRSCSSPSPHQSGQQELSSSSYGALSPGSPAVAVAALMADNKFDASSALAAYAEARSSRTSLASAAAWRESPEDLDGGPDASSSTAGPSSEDRRSNLANLLSNRSKQDSPVCCLHPGCTAKPFKRRADLDRHYKHRHAPESLKESFSCDYPRCARRLDPFHRLDHYRDHLRDFHKEDIEKRRGSRDEDGLGPRQSSAVWWRCAKCLNRVYVDRSGYDCPTCKASSSSRGKESRRRA